MNLADKTIKGTLWSYSAEILAKVISPLSFIVLTRILSPEDYGVVAVATTLLMFIDIICDLGTNKVIIQIDQNNMGSFKSYCNVAFYINICIGLVLFILTETFAGQIASYYSQPKSEMVIRVMAIQIICFSLSSIHNSLLRKALNFKFLFWTRLISIACPLLIAIPIAFGGGGLWALVISSCSGSILQCIVLWWYSNWRPNKSCSKKHLKLLFGKSIWNTITQLVTWVPISFDTYLIAKFINVTDLGLYTSSRGLFTAASGLILTPFLPVIYSTLSKLNEQEDRSQFLKTVYFSQKILFSIAVTCVIFVYLFADYIVPFLFNKQWDGITPIIKIVFVIMGYEYFGSIITESLRANGLFKELSFISLASLCLVIPSLVIAAESNNINTYAIVRSLTLYVPLIGNLIIAKKINIKTSACLKNNAYIIFSSFIIILLGFFPPSESIRPFTILIGKTIVFLVFLFLFYFFNQQTFQITIGLVRKQLHRKL